MSYYPLNLENIDAYLKTIPFFMLPRTHYSILNAGNMNQLIRFKTMKNSYLCKQALPYIKCLGSEYPLTFNRIEYEIKFYSIASSITSEFFPEIFHIDLNIMKAFVMQDLLPCETLYEGIMKKQKYAVLAGQISSFITALVNNTHSNLSEYIFFNTNPLTQITLDYCFDFPFRKHVTNHKSYQFSQNFHQRKKELKCIFLNKQETLLHGDLHPSSIMVSDKKCYVIDSEFARLGPIAYDVGNLFAHILLMYFYYAKRDQHYAHWLYQFLYAIWHDLKLKLNAFDTLTLMQEIFGFMGIEITRRICGAAGIQAIREASPPLQKTLEQRGLTLGCYLVENYANLTDLSELDVILSSILN